MKGQLILGIPVSEETKKQLRNGRKEDENTELSSSPLPWRWRWRSSILQSAGRSSVAELTTPQIGANYKRTATLAVNAVTSCKIIISN